MNNRHLKIMIGLWLILPLMAIGAELLTGFGVADWGMDRNEIIAAEGAPNAVGDTDGYLTYFEKEVMGKKAGVVYKFEKGCSALKTSKCRFSDGYYSFHDGSKEYSDELENLLTKKYGPPSSVHEEIDRFNQFADTGRYEIKKTIYTRQVGKVKIEHTKTFNLYDYTQYGKLKKSGPLRNFVHYYGPYHHKAEMNKKKAKERGL